MGRTRCEFLAFAQGSLLKNSAIVGVIAVSEKIAAEAEQENTSLFFSQLFEKQLARQRAALDGFVVGLNYNSARDRHD